MRMLMFIIMSTLLSLQAASAAPWTATGLEVGSPRSLRVVIEDLSQTTTEHGLTEKILKDKIELRLRRNGIAPTDSRASDCLIYLNLGTTRNGYSFTLEFCRSVSYRVAGQEYTISAPVWIKNGFGVCTDRRQFRRVVVDTILDRVDTFTNQFLKVNTR